MKLFYILISEWQYSRTRLAFALAIGLNGCFWALTIFPGHQRASALLVILIMTALLAGLGGERTRLRDKLDRRDALLPVSRKVLAMSRFLFPLSCWTATTVVALLVFILWNILGRDSEGFLSVKQWLSINGVVWLLIGLGRAFSDMRSWMASSSSRKMLWVGWKIVAVLIIFPFLFMLNAGILVMTESGMGDRFLSFFDSIGSVIILSLAGILAMALGFRLNQIKPESANP